MPGCDCTGTAERSYPSPRSGWRPGEATPRPRSVAAKRRHPVSEVRGGGQEELPHVRSQWPTGGDMLHPRSGVAAERSYPASEVSGGWKELPHMEVRGRGREEPPLARGQGRQPGGATPSWRPGAAAGRTNLRSGGCSGVGGPRGAIPC